MFKKIYNSNARLYYCIAYPSNVCDYSIIGNQEISKNHFNILIGNSGTSENNHSEAFNYLINHRKNNFNVFCPLSYGDNNYSNNIKILGKKYFKDNFFYLDKILQTDDYNSFLSSIDIAIMLQDRQAAMGNILRLLGLGKKVYFKSNAPHYLFLKRLGFYVYEIDKFELLKIKEVEKYSNKRLIEQHFSTKALINQWNLIFD